MSPPLEAEMPFPLHPPGALIILVCAHFLEVFASITCPKIAFQGKAFDQITEIILKIWPIK